MNRKIPMLVIGKEENVGNTYQDTAFKTYGPYSKEPDLIDAVKTIASEDPAVLAVDVLNGGTARGAVLAAVRSSVPVILWCHDERHSLASSSIAAGALSQLGHPYQLVHGEGPLAEKEMDIAVRAASAMHKLKNSRIGTGPLHFNLINSSADPLRLTSRFGIWTVPVSISSMKEKTDKISDTDIDNVIADLESRFCMETDRTALRKAAAFRIALKNTAAEERLDAVAVDCWNEMLPGIGVNPCLEFAFNEFIIACEGDVNLAVMLLAGEAISGRAGFCGDLYSMNEEDGTVSLIHCSGSCRLHAGKELLRIVKRSPPDTVRTEGVILSLMPDLAEEQGTVLLLHGQDLEYLYIRKCRILRSEFDKQMKTVIRIEGDAKAFLKEAAGNHYAVFPGDRLEEWKLWAKWSKVKIH